LITLYINDEEISVEDGTTVAAAILASGVEIFRRSVGGAPRGPICGMGICFECCVTINGVSLQRSCTLMAADGMRVTTDG
jgi:sarcosine oxidase subunit alpha